MDCLAEASQSFRAGLSAGVAVGMVAFAVLLHLWGILRNRQP